MSTQQRCSEAMSMVFVLSVIFLFIGVNGYGVIQISSIDELQKIGNDAGYPLNGEYELTQDIDASDTINWNDGAGFAPIGNNANPFTGVFDGKGYKIQNLYINRPGQSYVGLFGYVDSSGQVKNIGVENVQVVGGSSVGGLVGYNKNGMVMQSYSTGSVVGGISVGGLVGCNRGLSTVTQSYSTGSVVGNGSYIGGLAGVNNGTITQSYATGSVEGVNSGSFGVGGLVGYNYGTVTQSYSTGSVSGGDLVGGLIGLDYGGTITNSYWDTEMSGQSSSAGGEGKTTAEMKQKATFVGWDFATVWDIEENVTYPYLQALGQPVLPPAVVNKEIWSLSDLNKIGRDWEYPMDGHYTLMVDIDASETVNWDGGKGFKPIILVGRFDGNGHVIQNLYINRPEEDYVGLFGRVYREVLNIGVENIQVVGKEYVGGLVGWNDGTVTQSYSTGLVVGNYSAGGLVGYNNMGLVTQSYSMGSVSGGRYVGGLVGDNIGAIAQSYSTGSVSGDVVVGGLVGSNDGASTVTQSYSMGSVVGNGSYIGGLAGINNGTITQSYASGSVEGNDSASFGVGGLVGYNTGTVTQCYSTGSVSGSSDVGGLIGGNDSGSITQSYWDMQTSGQSSSAGGEGKTTAEMKQQATFVGWDFINIWGIINTNTYPYLLWQYYKVPNLVGLSQMEAEALIITRGFVVGTITEECSDIFPSGDVISQDPSPGTYLHTGAPVNLVVSTGPCPITVPDVVGMAQSSAENEIIGAGLTVGLITQECSDTVPSGDVISQDPLSGIQVVLGTTVELVVSTGPCPEGEGSLEGTPEGVVEGIPEGSAEEEGTIEGTPEGSTEGTSEGTVEGTPEGEGVIEGEGAVEGTTEGTSEGEGSSEGSPEGSAEGETHPHSADPNGDWQINLSELLRVIQFFNFGEYHCEAGTEDGYDPGPGDRSCIPHGSDYNPQDWTISLSELLRLIQFFNMSGYHPCPDGEDGYCPGIIK